MSTAEPEAAPKKRKKRQHVKMHDDYPAVCPKCSSNEVTGIKNVVEKPEVWERNGVTYTHAKRFYCVCKGCGQSRAVCRRLRRVENISE